MSIIKDNSRDFPYPLPNQHLAECMHHAREFTDGFCRKDDIPELTASEMQKLLAWGMLECCRKPGVRKQLHKITPEGLNFLEFVDQFKDVVDFIELASMHNMFQEFMLDAVFKSKGNVVTSKTQSVIKKIMRQEFPVFPLNWECRQFQCLKHLRRDLQKIRWLPLYCIYNFEDAAGA